MYNIYKTTRFKGSLLENYYNRKISANILMQKITEIWHGLRNIPGRKRVVNGEVRGKGRRKLIGKNLDKVNMENKEIFPLL